MKRKLIFVLVCLLLWPCMSLGGTVVTVWDANTETDLAGYNVYRSVQQGDTYLPWTKLNTDIIVEVTFTDADAPDGVNLLYVVTALDTSGNESAASNPAVYIVPVDCQSPGPPMGVTTQKPTE